MMIYRSLVVGLLAAIALLLTEQGVVLERVARRTGAPLGERDRVDRPAMRDHRGVSDERSPLTIVYVSRRGAGLDPVEVLGLGGDNVPLAIDDRPIRGSWTDAIRDRWLQARPGTYFELRVWSQARMGRMLVVVTA